MSSWPPVFSLSGVLLGSPFSVPPEEYQKVPEEKKEKNTSPLSISCSLVPPKTSSHLLISFSQLLACSPCCPTASPGIPKKTPHLPTPTSPPPLQP